MLSRGCSSTKSTCRYVLEVKKNEQDQPSRDISVALINLYRFEAWLLLIPLQPSWGNAVCAFVKDSWEEVSVGPTELRFCGARWWPTKTPPLLDPYTHHPTVSTCRGRSPWCFSGFLSLCSGCGTVQWPTSQVTRSLCHNRALWYMTRVMCTEFGGVTAAGKDTWPVDFVWIGLSSEKGKN